MKSKHSIQKFVRPKKAVKIVNELLLIIYFKLEFIFKQYNKVFFSKFFNIINIIIRNNYVFQFAISYAI